MIDYTHSLTHLHLSLSLSFSLENTGTYLKEDGAHENGDDDALAVKHPQQIALAQLLLEAALEENNELRVPGRHLTRQKPRSIDAGLNVHIQCGVLLLELVGHGLSGRDDIDEMIGRVPLVGGKGEARQTKKLRCAVGRALVDNVAFAHENEVVEQGEDFVLRGVSEYL
jgi:hypothetical protein